MLDKIQTYGVDSTLVAMTKQEFFAQAEKRIRDSAGSGFEEWGKDGGATTGDYTTINDGLWSNATGSNQLQMSQNPSAGSVSGVSRTAYAVAQVNGTSLNLGNINGGNTLSIIKFPDAPDGTKTYDSATGIVTQHADSATAFASETTTNLVITSRKDFVFLEVFHEEVSLDAGVDGNKDEVYYKGMVQSGKTNPYGITSTTRDDGYTRFGVWDSATTGQRVIWSTMNFIERNEFLQDPENNFYRDGDKLIQVRGRIRVIEGLGDDWHATSYLDSTADYLSYKNGFAFDKLINPRGSDVVVRDLGSEGRGIYDPVGTSSSNKNTQNTGAYGCRLDSIAYDIAYNGLCFAIPIALVQRRNQGGYHPALNPDGCSRWVAASASDVYWYAQYGQLVTARAECFNFGTGVGEVSTTNGAIGGTFLGRPDDRVYDAIYASDVQDLRMSSKRLPLSEIREKYKRKAIAGTVRGYEGVPFWSPAGLVVDSSNAAASQMRVEVDGVRIIPKVGESFWTTDTGGNLIPLIHTEANGEYITATSNFDRVQGAVVWLGVVNLHKQANPTWTDIIGDPANIAATFPNGVEGEWLPQADDGTDGDYELSRKATSDAINAVFTNDDGVTWDTTSGVIGFIANTIDGAIGSAGRVTLKAYETQAHFTEDDIVSEVLDLGGVYGNGRHTFEYGALLTSTLIGKVGTSNANIGNVQIPLDSFRLESPSGKLWNTNPPEHDGRLSTLLPQADTPTVKALDYLSEDNGIAKLCYAYKEMVFDTDENTSNITVVTNGDTTEVLEGEKVRLEGFNVITNAVWIRRASTTTNRVINDTYFGTMIEAPDGNLYVGTTMYWERSTHGWGDDNQFPIGNDQSTTTDDNGNKVLFGTASFNTQFFIDRSSGAL